MRWSNVVDLHRHSAACRSRNPSVQAYLAGIMMRPGSIGIGTSRQQPEPAYWIIHFRGVDMRMSNGIPGEALRNQIAVGLHA